MSTNPYLATVRTMRAAVEKEGAARYATPEVIRALVMERAAALILSGPATPDSASTSLDSARKLLAAVYAVCPAEPICSACSKAMGGT